MPASLEDLRPRRLDEMVGQEQALAVLKGLVAQARNGLPLPNLLFSGQFGTGKTTAAYALAREVLGEHWEENFRELDTSGDRGLDVVRNEVIPWLGRMPAYGAPFKILFLDEADYLTQPAQAALRRVMETETDVTRFILACNTPTQIIGAIHSRCLPVRFRPLTPDEVRTLVLRTAERLALHPSEQTVESIVRHSRGQARDAVQALVGGESATASNWERLDAEVVHLFTPNGVSRDARIAAFIEFLRAEGWTEWGELLYTLDQVVAEKAIPTLHGYDHFITEASTSAYRCKLVDLPMFEVKAMLHRVVP